MQTDHRDWWLKMNKKEESVTLEFPEWEAGWTGMDVFNPHLEGRAVPDRKSEASEGASW